MSAAIITPEDEIGRFCAELRGRVAIPAGMTLTTPIRSRRKIRIARSYAIAAYRVAKKSIVVIATNLAGPAVILTIGAFAWVMTS